MIEKYFGLCNTPWVVIEETKLVDDQHDAYMKMLSGENVFLTGSAGSGKSYLVKRFLKEMGKDEFPVLASTGAAAVLVGGRTFHSFFGLGILEGGVEQAFERAKKDGQLRKRIRSVEGIIIDEISMIAGDVLSLADRIARWARDNEHPFGGLRVIAVGDFAQLPPVVKNGPRQWCFQHPVWSQSGFQSAFLKTNHRTQDPEFIQFLSYVRRGIVNDTVIEFMNDRIRLHEDTENGIRLFPFRKQSEDFNRSQLDRINEDPYDFPTLYWGNEQRLEKIKEQFPIPQVLTLKLGAEVIFTQNDPQKRWINGTQGIVTEIHDKKIIVEKKNGREVTVEKVTFDWLNADGEVVASATQYPLNLGYATTIHKSQGATMDKIWCDLSRLWEPGQAYVALSRLQTSQGLNLIRWNPNSIKSDPAVLQFYQSFYLNFT